MIKGVEALIIKALDTKDYLADEMIKAGVEPMQALIASTVATKLITSQMLENEMGNCSASEITKSLSDNDSTKLLN
jgi:hypothetical protein